MNKFEIVNYVLTRINPDKIKTTAAANVNGIISVIAWLLGIIGGVALLISVFGYFLTDGNNETSLKRWLIGIVISAIVLSIVVGYQLWLTFS